jgi:hypothetical protein
LPSERLTLGGKTGREKPEAGVAHRNRSTRYASRPVVCQPQICHRMSAAKRRSATRLLSCCRRPVRLLVERASARRKRSRPSLSVSTCPSEPRAVDFFGGGAYSVCPTSASTASRSRGMSFDRTVAPSSPTRTSSSIRIPNPRYAGARRESLTGM